jgi:hypothetical protein
VVADDAASIRRRARAVARRRARAAELRESALTELGELIDEARDVGVSITELAELAGFETTKPLYDLARRRRRGD